MGHKSKAKSGTVATGHRLCTEVAASILKAGGNAFDAALAAGFCSTIAEPTLCSLGGGGFLLARTANNEHILFDFFVDCPGRGRKLTTPKLIPVEVQFTSASQVFHIGPGTISVPGTLAGFLHVHKRLARMPLKELLQPTIELAKQGAKLNETQAYTLRLLTPILCHSEEGRSIYAPRGQILTEGQSVKNSNLAQFLEDLPSDLGRSFYKGDLAEKICQHLGSESQLQKVDLSRYEVSERQPLEMTYRQYKLHTNPPPSLGGSMIVRLLSRLQTHDLKQLGWGSFEHLKLLTETMQELEAQKGLNPASFFTKGTTHISVSDSDFNFVSLSLTNGEGSGHFVPGTGIMLNNMLGEEDLWPEDFGTLVGGTRIASMMSPCILEKDPCHCIVTGSGGSKRIRSSLMQVISNLVDFDKTLKEAVESPRLNWDGEKLQIEAGYSKEVIQKLKAFCPVNEWQQLEFYFGGAHSVVPNQQAAGDPRRGGAAIRL